MIPRSHNVQADERRKKRLALRLPRAIALGLLLGVVAPSGAQEIPNSDAYTTHVQRAKQLLLSEKPSEARQELDAAFAIRNEPRVLYLQGVASQELGMNREAVGFFQRFLVAADGTCCADERAYASRRIAKLRPLLGPSDLATGSPLARPTPPSAWTVVTTDTDDVYWGTVSIVDQDDSRIEVTTSTGTHESLLLKNVRSQVTDRQARSLPIEQLVPTTCPDRRVALPLIREFAIADQPPLRAELLSLQPGASFRIRRSVNGTLEVQDLPWGAVGRVSRPAEVRDQCLATEQATDREKPAGARALDPRGPSIFTAGKALMITGGVLGAAGLLTMLGFALAGYGAQSPAEYKQDNVIITAGGGLVAIGLPTMLAVGLPLLLVGDSKMTQASRQTATGVAFAVPQLLPIYRPGGNAIAGAMAGLSFRM